MTFTKGSRATADLIAPITSLIQAAGEKTLEVYASDFQVASKDDKSPVTEADKRAEEVILTGLADLTPEIPVVAEEAVSDGNIPEVGHDPFWLVDPVDGTKEFINKRDEFTVNIGLIVDREPIFGAVLAPALGALYIGATGHGCQKMMDGEARAIQVKIRSPEGVVVVGSRSHGNPEALQEFLGDTPVLDNRAAGSSLKFCLVAEGEADLYPRHGPTMEWDTAAGHAVVLAAGGSVLDLETNAALLYGKTDFRNPYFLVSGG